MPLHLPPTEQMLNITLENGQVVIQFSRPVQELCMGPQDAANFSRALLEAAKICYKRWHQANDYSLNPANDVLKGRKDS